MLLDRWCSQTLLQHLYIGRNMDGLDIGQLAQILLLTPDRKLHGSARIGPPCVRIPYIGCEEFNEPPRRVGIRREKLREHRPGGNSDNVLGHALTHRLVTDNVLYHSRVNKPLPGAPFVIFQVKCP